MQILYNLGIRLYSAFIQIAGIFVPKAKAFLTGRRDLFPQLSTFRNTCSDASITWVHCASLGEFEQGRPVIEGLKKKWPEKKIVLTFFSPSGYDIRKNYEQADFVSYIPLDTPSNARKFIEILRPDLVIFVKYEFWYNHLSVLYKKNIPHLLISAIFSPSQVFFKWYGSLFRQLLRQYNQIFVQDNASQQLLTGIDLQNHQLAGDTRIDRVAEIAMTTPLFPEIKKFVADKKVFIAGSTWSAGEDILCPFFNKMSTDWKVIIAPHEISATHIKKLEERLQIKSIRYSALKEFETEVEPGAQLKAALQVQLQGKNLTSLADTKVLIIDNVGLLSALYQYGHIAYIGGGFGVGIHNTLEPATFALPILFGPNHLKFKEALSLKDKGGAFVIQNEFDLQKTFTRLQQKQTYDSAAAASRSYVDKNRGATEQVLAFIESI